MKIFAKPNGTGPPVLARVIEELDAELAARDGAEAARLGDADDARDLRDLAGAEHATIREEHAGPAAVLREALEVAGETALDG